MFWYTLFLVVLSISVCQPFTMFNAFNCLLENNLSFTEIQELETIKNSKDVPKNMLCFMKCYGEKAGFINDGQIKTAKIIEIPFLPKMNEQALEKSKECLAAVGKIKTCDDMIPVKDCLDILVGAN